MKTLLPPNATSLEQAFDKATALQIEAIPVERIFEQWHPYKCPVHLLGWLAWALSVDDWNPDWPEAIKREVIASSIDVHRHKGTKASVKKALEALDIDLQLIEFQDDPQNNVPHEILVRASAHDNFASGGEQILDANFYSLAKRQVEHTKPARTSFEIQVGAKFSQVLSLGSAIAIKQNNIETMQLRQDPISIGSRLSLGSLLKPWVLCQAVFDQTPAKLKSSLSIGSAIKLQVLAQPAFSN